MIYDMIWYKVVNLVDGKYIVNILSIIIQYIVICLRRCHTAVGPSTHHAVWDHLTNRITEIAKHYSFCRLQTGKNVSRRWSPLQAIW